MAKDDYNVIVFKVLTYLYGCLQRKYSFNEAEFLKLLDTQHIAEQYLSDVLRLMQEEGFITGLAFQKAWGNCNECRPLCRKEFARQLFRSVWSSPFGME